MRAIGKGSGMSGTPVFGNSVNTVVVVCGTVLVDIGSVVDETDEVVVVSVGVVVLVVDEVEVVVVSVLGGEVVVVELGVTTVVEVVEVEVVDDVVLLVVVDEVVVLVVVDGTAVKHRIAWLFACPNGWLYPVPGVGFTHVAFSSAP